MNVVLRSLSSRETFSKKLNVGITHKAYFNSCESYQLEQA